MSFLFQGNTENVLKEWYCVFVTKRKYHFRKYKECKVPSTDERILRYGVV